MLLGDTGLVDRNATSMGILYDVTFCVHNYKEIVHIVKKINSPEEILLYRYSILLVVLEL